MTQQQTFNNCTLDEARKHVADAHADGDLNKVFDYERKDTRHIRGDQGDIPVKVFHGRLFRVERDGPDVGEWDSESGTCKVY